MMQIVGAVCLAVLAIMPKSLRDKCVCQMTSQCYLECDALISQFGADVVSRITFQCI